MFKKQIFFSCHCTDISKMIQHHLTIALQRGFSKVFFRCASISRNHSGKMRQHHFTIGLQWGFVKVICCLALQRDFQSCEWIGQKYTVTIRGGIKKKTVFFSEKLRKGGRGVSPNPKFPYQKKNWDFFGIFFLKGGGPTYSKRVLS